MKLLPSIFRLSFILAFFLFFGTLGWSNCTLTTGWEPWEPYQFEDQNKKLTGLDVELLLAIAKNADCTVSYQSIPWKRHLRELARGRIDIATGASKTVEREEYAFFSDPYRTESVVLYVRRGERKKYDLKTLGDIVKASFRIGVVRGYYYGENFARLFKKENFRLWIDEVTNDKQNYEKLRKKRIDGFLADPFTAAVQIRKRKLQNEIEVYPLHIYSADIFVMFSKKSVQYKFVQKFNQSLKQIIANGTRKKIFEKYLH